MFGNWFGYWFGRWFGGLLGPTQQPGDAEGRVVRRSVWAAIVAQARQATALYPAVQLTCGQAVVPMRAVEAQAKFYASTQATYPYRFSVAAPSPDESRKTTIEGAWHGTVRR